MEAITDASRNFETPELLFSLLVNHKTYRDSRDSSGRPLHPRGGSIQRVSSSPQQEGIISYLAKWISSQSWDIFMLFAGLVRPQVDCWIVLCWSGPDTRVIQILCSSLIASKIALSSKPVECSAHNFKPGRSLKYSHIEPMYVLGQRGFQGHCSYSELSFLNAVLI